MKHVIIQRAWSDRRATLGMLKILTIDHDPIFTLENPLRASYTDNRIPEGGYYCTPFSGPKFKNVYEIKDVPDRSAILIHWGNFERDTSGCILIGLSAATHHNGVPWIGDSIKAFSLFRSIIGDEDFLLRIEPEKFEIT